MFLSKRSNGSYYLFYFDDLGKRHKVSTHSTRKSDALKFLQAYKQGQQSKGSWGNRDGFDFAVRGRYIAVIRTVASPQPSSRCSGPRSCFSVLEPSSTTPWLQA
jgi:hypothetical protein